MTGSNGWMTARKTSSQIARDKSKAEESRRRRKGLAPQKPKKKGKPIVDSDDEIDSLDDFVVDDDEEIEEDDKAWSEGDEEDEEDDEALKDIKDDDSESPSTAQPTKKPKTAEQKTALDRYSSSSSSEDEFFSMSKLSNRKSKPAPHMLRESKSSSLKRPAQKENKVVDLLASSEDEAPPTKRLKKKPPVHKHDDKQQQKGTSKKTKLGKYVSLSSDDDDSLLADPFARQNKVPKRTVKKELSAKSSKEEKMDKAIKSNRAAVSRFFGAAKSPKASGDRRDEDEPTPVINRRSKKNKSRVFDEGHDADEKVKTSKDTTELVDSDIDDDEQMAMALALSASMADQQNGKSVARKNRFSKYASRKSTEKCVRESLEDSDEENDVEEPDDEDDNCGDDELDEDAKEARKILETAQRLSGQVLQHLKSWGGDEAAATGMIVQDGAIALTMGDANQKVSSSWISNETFKKVCPSVDLAPYQQIGVNWLALLHNLTVDVDGKATNVNGVLADEMGLGKTCQTIVFLSWLKYHQHGILGRPGRGANGNPISLDSDDESMSDPNCAEKSKCSVMPHLVVVPASVLQNWMIEFEKFAPHLNVVKYHGSMAEREEIKEHLEQFRARKDMRASDMLDVILAPLTYFQKEKSDDRSFLKKFRYDYLVCDEAHLLKNFRGQRYRTLDKFRTKHRLLLSGTPVMNNPQELMSLLCFLMPLFSRKSQGFAPDEDQNDGGSSMLQHFVALDKEGDDDAAAYRKLKVLFAPFVLRRRKQDVLSQIMPPKQRKVEFVELDTNGRRIYNGVLERHIANRDRSAREHVFTQLRKAAHHPLLLRTRYLEPAEKNHLVDCFYKYGAFRGEACTREKVYEEVERFNDFDIHLTALELLEANPHREEDLRRYILEEEDLFSSAKCVRLRTLLPELVSKGHRILIFSVWTNCLDLLSCLLEQLNMKFLRMEGSTPVSERQALIDEFNRDASIPIFLLSTKACGLGINLTAADTAIMHDIDFNPFNDLQAEDRCHRIGQKKPVTVYKLVAKDTVDEDIYTMQERKARMSAAIMEASSGEFESKKERDNVLQTAVDRFLGSPACRKRSAEKENGGNVLAVDKI